MLAKTGLLVVSNPKQIERILSSVQKHVKNTLYIQLLSALGDPLGSFHPKTFNAWPKFSKTILSIYSQAATHCSNIDVKVLLSGIKYKIPKIQTKKPIDVIIFDKLYSQKEIEEFVKNRIQNITQEYNVVTLDSSNTEPLEDNNDEEEIECKHTVLGGTFDRLHMAHKLLLSEAALRASEKVTVGITEENMLHNKVLWELIEQVDVRMNAVNEFLSDICPELVYDIVPISDPFGPAIVDPTMELIVLSRETLRGGEKINEIRREKNLNLLKIIPIELMDAPKPKPFEETKISSSTTRIRLLGTLLRPVLPNDSIPKSPYVIGLTGGIATGKSGVAKHLEDLGALVISCDLIAHSVYKLGTPCHALIVEHFGEQVLAEDGEINRKVLGGIVFKAPEEMKKLNSLVWPAIAEEVLAIIKNTDRKVVVIEAAVLLSAGWADYCHEIWITLVPREEVVRRLVRRNCLTEEQAISRIDAQPLSTFYVNFAHVAFSTLWTTDYTKEQVVKAWTLLQNRISC